MRIEDNDVPHIQAECSRCGFLFDMKFGLGCPNCSHVGVKWARLVSEQEAQEHRPDWIDNINSRVDRLRNAAIDLDPDSTREVLWLEKLYALESPQ